MMAAQLTGAAVQRHARVAVRAGGCPAAGAAKQAGRVAAAIQKHDHLPAGLEVPPHGLHRRLRQPLIARDAAQVHETHARGPCGAGPLRQGQPRIAPLRHVLERLERRRGRSEHDGYLRALRPPDCQIARRVAEAFLLLVGGVVLLIDHDEAELVERGEYRRAGADDDPRLTPMGGAPGVAALAGAALRMHDDDAGTEAALETLDQLRRQRDLGHEHQHLAAMGQRPGNGLKIHFGLAAARDAVQEMRGESAQRGHDGVDHPRLRLGGLETARVNLDGRGLDRPALPADESACAKGAKRRFELRKILGRCAPRRQPLEQGPLPRRTPLRRRSVERLAPCRRQRPHLGLVLRRLACADSGRQRCRHDLAEGMVVVLGGETQQIEGHRVEDRALVQDLEGRLEFRSRDFRVAYRSDKHADDLTPAEGNADADAPGRCRRQRGIRRR